MIEELVSRIFLTRNLVHLAHWKTNSYAKHVALGDFYEGVIEQIDKVVEVYQGAIDDLIDNVELAPYKSVDIIAHLTSDLRWLEDNEDKISESLSYVGNLLQELMALYAQTLYKLNRLS